MMKRITTALIAAAFAAVALSCDKIETGPVEGQPTSIKICVSIPMAGNVTVTKATEEQETKVNAIALLLYKDENSLPLVIEEPTYGLPEVVTNTSYTYTIEFSDENLTSGKWYLYAIANYNYTGFGTVDLGTLSQMTKKDMDSYVVVKQNEYIDLIDDGMLLTGKFGTDGSVELEPSGNDFSGNADATIHLRRLTAKITFNIATGDGVQFIPESYTIYNYSQSATLMERTGWAQKGGTSSYEYGTFPGTLKYLGAKNESERFMTAMRYIAGNTFTFYMPENVQLAKSAVSDYNSREKRNIENDPTSREFLYAPDNGTYVVIKGQYNGPGAKYDAGTSSYVADTENTVSGEVSYTIHLGNFSAGKVNANTKGGYDNFTVRRNTRYTYNISIDGVKNIIVEALTDVENNSGAEGTLISNANSTNLELDAHFETVMVELPSESVTDYILRLVTPYETTLYSAATSGARPTDVGWVSFARPRSSVQFPKYPGSGSSSLTDIFGLMGELKDFNGTSGDHYLYENGKIYVAAFVDEYYYDTKPGTATKAALTDFVNAPDRMMSVLAQLDISKDTYSTYASENLFTIKQASIKSMYNLSVDNPMGLETFEEFPDPVYKKNDTVSSDPKNWGWGNFVTNFSLDSDHWNEYIDSTKLGHFDNLNVISTESLRQNYGDLQCISRNRDENGDGIINRDEIKWYLPSQNECLTIWNGFYALSDQARVNDSHQHYTSTNGYGRYWWNDEGSAFGVYYTGNFYTPLVRCVRALGQYDEVPTKVSSVNGQVISVSGLGSGSVRSTGKRGEYTAGHYRNDAADILPTSFRVAKNNLSFTGKESFVVSAPMLTGCGFDGTGFWFLLNNYQDLIAEGYSLFYTVGTSTTKQTFSAEGVRNIVPEWVDDVAAVKIYATITSNGTTYTSDATIARVSRQQLAEPGYVYSSTITHGAYNTADSTYPYVDAAEYEGGRFGFRIANFDKIGTLSYGVNVQRGSYVAGGASWYGYYPYVNSTSVSNEKLNVNLCDSSSNYWYVIGQSGKDADNYTGGVQVGSSVSSFAIPLSSLVWSDDVAVVTLYTKYTGIAGDYTGTECQTVLKVTRNFKEGKAGYTVNNGDQHVITADKTGVNVDETMWKSDQILVKVFNQSYLGAQYLSTITFTRVANEYTYASSFVNGATQSITLSSVATRSTFTGAEVKGSNYCEQYYYENADKSDLGYWRIPNERELGLMFEYFTLSPSTAARSLYYRKYDSTPTSKPYSLTITGGNIFTQGLSSYVIRCVRDN